MGHDYWGDFRLLSYLFAPAGVNFFNMGVIYSFFFYFSLSIWNCSRERRLILRKKLFKPIGILFSVSSVLITIWEFTWHYGMIGLSEPIARHTHSAYS